MVTKRIRSEYMKKFKDPKWETYTRCYEEMLKYRLTRRLLEHTHNPWFWAGSESDSESGGRTPPPHPPPSKNQVQTETSRDQAAAEAELEECEGARNTEPVPRMALQEGEETADLGSQLESARVGDEERASSQGNKQKKLIHTGENRVRDTAGRQQSKSSRPSKQTLGTERVRPAPARQAEEDCKESRHPFALYGSGEKAADMAGRKTHNVGPAASTNEIHDSALRAKTRREVERQIQTQKTERRRAKSVDVNKGRKLVQPEYNPWLTEYMRCFSARSR